MFKFLFFSLLFICLSITDTNTSDVCILNNNATCFNHGQCLNISSLPQCVCFDNYNGTNCQIYSPKPLPKWVTPVAITIVVVVLCGSFIAAICVILCNLK